MREWLIAAVKSFWRSKKNSFEGHLMEDREYCYFLVFRVRRDFDATTVSDLDWKNPTGGYVAEPARYVNEYPIPDMEEVLLAVYARYHCPAYEKLCLAPVFERHEQKRAFRLHIAYEAERELFAELMECTG